ncbi:ribosome maturation factor RimM [Peptococcaceae bacterium 1198_IL3148]
MGEQYITIGEIVNTQGIKGEVRVLPQTDFPERFKELNEVLIYHQNQRFTYQITSARQHKQFIIIKFAEVTDMNGAEKLKGALMQITPDQLVSLPKDNYYIFEIVGLDVYTTAGEKLGSLKQVLKTGANDVYVVKPPTGADILVPALKQVVKEINIEANRMVVELPEGLLD